MKIAIPATAPNLDAQVEHKLGTAAYLLVIDMDDMSFEAIEGPPPSHGPGAGIQAVSLVVGMGVRVILTGYISPHIAGTLRQNGIEIITSVSGRVRNAVEKYERDHAALTDITAPDDATEHSSLARVKGRDALRKAAKQFFSIFPILIAVILLVGLFQAFLPRKALLTLFSGNTFWDTVWGACAGSIVTGNPINSYVIGETLLNLGVSLFGVTALMLSWVSVGLVQLPAEISALGIRFAVVRNSAAFLIAIVASVVIVWLSEGAL